jgi:hypothetical protein
MLSKLTPLFVIYPATTFIHVGCGNAFVSIDHTLYQLRQEIAPGVAIDKMA